MFGSSYFKSITVSILTGILFAGLFSFAMYALATPPTSEYTAGETLDPSCSPSDTNCAVLAAATASDNLSFFAATTSLQLLGVISNETGSGALVFASSPALVTPTLGAAIATSINGLTITSSTGTLTITNGKTLSVSNTLTLAGTDSSTLNIGSGGTLGTAAYTASTAYTNTALSNLASVAINTALISDTDDTDDLGSATKEWKDIYIDGTAYLDAIDLNGTAITSTATELNYLDITTLGTGAASKAVVLDAGDDYIWPATGLLTYGGTAITATGAELNILDGATLTVTELNYVDGVTSAIQTQLDGKANTALSNLASVAINTALISDTDDTDDLGSATKEWKDIYIDGTAYLDAIDLNGTALSSTATQLNYLNQATGSTGDANTSIVFSNNASIATPTITAPTFSVDGYSRIAFNLLNGIVEGRLTLTTATPVTTSDVTGAATIYFTPYNGDRIAVYDSTNWGLYTFSELSLSLTLTSDKNYDVFIYDNQGTLTLELSAAWTNDTTRADALYLQDGAYVKFDDVSRRYLGTIRASGTDTTEDSASKRYVWNYYNRVTKHMSVVDTTDSWTYTTATWRAANNSTANRVQYVVGLNEDEVIATVHATATNTAAVVSVGVGVDSTSANSAQIYGALAVAYSEPEAFYKGFPGLGYHFLQWLEISQAQNTTDWHGDNGVPDIEQSGLLASSKF